MPEIDRRTPNQSEEAVVRDIAIRLMREGTPLHGALYRKDDTSELIGKVERYIRVILNTANYEFLTTEQNRLLGELKARSTKESLDNGVNFSEVEKALKANPDLIDVLANMKEPVVLTAEDNAFVIVDFCLELPEDRRGLDYKAAKDRAEELGLEFLTERQYLRMRDIREFDKDTQIWLKKPASRGETHDVPSASNTGGKTRVNYGRVFYGYGHRGWRGALRVPKAS